MLIYVPEGVVDAVRYPFTMGDLRDVYPDVSFPEVITEEILADFDVFPVVMSPLPSYNYQTEKAVLRPVPEYINETWREVYDVVAKTQEEIDEAFEQESAKVRAQRDIDLANSDWVVIKSTETGTPVPSEWLAYRQALRDLTDAVGFPYDMEWPEAPIL